MKRPFLSGLSTLAEVNAVRRATPKYAVPTAVERAAEKIAADRADERKLRAWATAVKKRDEWKDRWTGKAVIKTNQAHPDRAEAHHVVSRSDAAVRYDVRNGITLAWSTHEKVERNELEIVGTKFFRKHGTRYIDATHRVIFKERS